MGMLDILPFREVGLPFRLTIHTSLSKMRESHSVSPHESTPLIIAWIGQSCSYVQIGNSLNILTDPIFGFVSL